jgi:hypothetical protein
MKLTYFGMLALLTGVWLMLGGTELIAAGGRHGGAGGRGGGRAIQRGGGGGGGGAHRVGGMGGGGRVGGSNGSSVSRGGYGAGGGGQKTASRTTNNRSGGLAPNKNIDRGNLNKSQAESKFQNRSKGSASALPSVAQGKRAGSGMAGNKGFPDVSAKAGTGQLAGKVQGSKGGKLQGAQGGQFGGGLANIREGDSGGRLQGGGTGQLRNNLSPERNQAIANRQQYWDKWGKANGGKLSDFRTNRGKDWSNINNFRKNENVAGRFNSSQWNTYRNNVNGFRNNRSVEINNNIQNHFDNNFNDNWWGRCGWYRGPAYSGGNPWWWWGTATFAAAGTFLAIDAIRDATYHPPVYDYGVNVVYQGDDVYVDGQRTASTKEYAQQAIALANEPAAEPPPPAPPESGQQPDWLPLGVWALAQEEKGDAYMFFQLSIDKDGVVSGAYQNVLSGEMSPISGQVDKKTQRVAWKIGTNNTVIETGLQSLTQDVASCLVHFGPDTTQTWLLVRLKQPEMPTAPQTAETGTKGS